MKKFIIEDSFWNIFPDAKIGVLLLENYESKDISPDDIVKLLEESNELAHKYLTNPTFSENNVIQVYRKAYQKFKTKKGARCSLEALLKRSISGNPVKSINSLVDIYNSASLRYALPVGAEDIDTFVGDLKLTVTQGGDEFYLIGEAENNPTLEGEICYKDDKGAVCRCFNWRDGERTMISDKTKNAFVVIELVDSNRLSDLNDALDFISQKSQKYLNANIKKFILDTSNKTIIIKE